jgi:hypothetical protein
MLLERGQFEKGGCEIGLENQYMIVCTLER